MITKRRRSIAAVAASALAGAALGAGGITAALWFDSAHAGGQISSGYEYFAAGIVESSDTPDDDSALSTADDDRDVTVTIGSDHAQELVDDGSIAIPLRTDSISQGNKGLTYTITQPNWGDGVFGNSKPFIFSVEKARDCAVDRAPSSPPGDLTSTPVDASYSGGSEATTEYWCLVAEFDRPKTGEYSNEATVETDQGASDSDTWSADVTSGLDPADESDHPITFHYDTFRPGEQP